MKKLFSIMAIAALVFAGTLTANASAVQTMPTSTQMLTTAATVSFIQDEDAAGEEAPKGWHQNLKQRFIEGGPGFMGIVLLCLILGLAIGIEAAKEVCRNTKGPVASIYYQGLDRADESIEAAEKAVVAYGGVQMGQLEKNVSWISLFIALAPMLGFMGTVIGMILAFDKIEAAGDMNPSLVAGGIKVALLTTVFGLVVAIILQIFYNYIIAKIDSIVNSMEDASITLIDMLVDYKNKK
jgi:biopolymer transport protein ExbB